ncbi:MAG: dihydroorotase family protein [Thermoprotei archaeon]
MTDLLLKNAKIWIGNGFTEGYILVKNGVIKTISKEKPGKADEEIDCYHQPVIPGGIDIHAHVYDPEYTEHEDWSSGSLAAAYGGLTTVFDMPLRLIVDTREMVRKKVEEAKKNSYINYGIIAGFMNENNYKRIYELAEEGIKGFKVFTARPFKPIETAYPYILEAIANVDGVAIIHAEDDALIDYGEAKYRERDEPIAWHLHRTGYAEAAAIIRIGYIALETHTHIHIAHLSSSEGVEAVEFLARKGVRITTEVCPHHLYFTREDSDKFGNYIKVAPTLKSREDVMSLWKALDRGIINAYVSDNAPSPRKLKETSVWDAWGGIPNLEIMIPFLYTFGVLQRRISFNRFLEVTSKNPAMIMDIYPEKGELCIGCDADLIVIDTEKPVRYDSSKHHHKVNWSPWDGMEFYGTPIHVIVNGKPVIINRELAGKPGIGKFVKKKIRTGVQ